MNEPTDFSIGSFFAAVAGPTGLGTLLEHLKSRSCLDIWFSSIYRASKTL